jgi:AcrR family transcriptional regulator
MTTKQQLVSEYRRGEILAAARKVFARRGFAQGVVDEIASEAGLAKGTLYLYFRSKRDIYLALLQHDMEDLKTSTLKKVDAADGTKEKIRAFILARLENAETNREFFRIMDSQPAGPTFTRGQYRDWLREPVVHLAAAIDAASARGEVRPVPSEKIAWVVADLARGSIARRLVAQPSTPLVDEAGFLVDLIWAAIRTENVPAASASSRKK